MGQKAVQIANLDVEKLIGMLNSALAEEWLAYYQYWVGARVMEGPMRKEVEPELLLHATEELGHAVLLIDRIIQLGGTPILNPKDWSEHAKCAYAAPEDPYIEAILNQNVEGERCAIANYQALAEYTDGKDLATYRLATQILNDELEHEEDLEAFLKDLNRLKEDIARLRV